MDVLFPRVTQNVWENSSAPLHEQSLALGGGGGGGAVFLTGYEDQRGTQTLREHLIETWCSHEVDKRGLQNNKNTLISLEMQRTGSQRIGSTISNVPFFIACKLIFPNTTLRSLSANMV